MPGYVIAIIVIAVIVAIFAIIFSLSAKIYVSYDKEVSARIKFLFIDKAFDLDDVLRKLLKIQDNVETKVENIDKKADEKKQEKAQAKATIIETEKEQAKSVEVVEVDANANEQTQAPAEQDKKAEPKPNFIKQIYDKDGILGILLLVSNLLQSVNSAIITLIKGLHIRSLYVKMIIGGSDAAKIAMDYGKICGSYYALKGLIFSTMKVHEYDECIEPDYLSNSSEYGFDLVLSISIGAVVKVGLVAVKTFLANLIKNK